MKYIKPFYSAIGVLMMAIAIAIGIQGCKATKTMAYNPLIAFVPYAVHDTLKPVQIPRKAMTSSQLKDFVRPFFQMNIDTFITPKLDKLTVVMGTQAAAIENLSSTIQQMRERSIKRNDSLERLNANMAAQSLKYQGLAIHYQEELLRVKREENKQNEAQLKGLNKIVNIMLALGVIIILAVSGLYFFVQHIWSIIKKNIHYV